MGVIVLMDSEPLDFERLLHDSITGKRLDRRGYALVQSCRSWLEKNGDNEDMVALYDIEDLVSPERFLRLNYFGSLKFSTQESWKQAFTGWLRWLHDQRPEGDLAKEKVRGNISILDAALKNPAILAQRPYTFLGWGDSLKVQLCFENPGSFFLDYHYSIVPDWEETGANARVVYDYVFGTDPGVFYLDGIEKRRVFRDITQRQQTVRKELFWNPYRRLEPETFVSVLDGAQVKEAPNEYVERLWKPQFWIPPHDNLEPQFESPEETKERSLRDAFILLRDPKKRKRAIAIASETFRQEGIGQIPNLETLVKGFLERLGKDLSNPAIQGMAPYASDIATSAERDLSAGIGYALGGIQTDFVQVKYTPEERYELIGDFLMRLIRQKLVKEKKRHVSAYFGWLGRRLMKHYFPETKFSLDWHVEKVNETKRGYIETIDQALAALKAGITEYTFENANRLFSSLGKEKSVGGLDLFGSSKENFIDRYVWWFWLHHRLGELFCDETEKMSLPCDAFGDFSKQVRFYLDNKNDADRLMGNQSKFRERFGEGYGEIESGQQRYNKAKKRGGFTNDAELQSEEGLVKAWYASKRYEMTHNLRFARRKLSCLSGEYFAVIGDPLFRVGYATAEKYWNSFPSSEQLINDLSTKITLPARMLKKEVPFKGNDPLADLVMSHASESPYHGGA